MENEQTYAYETNPNSEALVKLRKAELKELKIKAQKDKRYRLAKNAEKRVIRDDRIDRINLRLKSIKEQMILYNNAGKIEKDRINILEIIQNLIINDTELLEDIERSIPKISNEEFEAEAVDESEVILK